MNALTATNVNSALANDTNNEIFMNVPLVRSQVFMFGDFNYHYDNNRMYKI